MEENEKRKKAEFRKKVREQVTYLTQTDFCCGTSFMQNITVASFIICLDGERGVRFHPRQFTTEEKI